MQTIAPPASHATTVPSAAPLEPQWPNFTAAAAILCSTEMRAPVELQWSLLLDQQLRTLTNAGQTSHEDDDGTLRVSFRGAGWAVVLVEPWSDDLVEDVCEDEPRCGCCGTPLRAVAHHGSQCYRCDVEP